MIILEALWRINLGAKVEPFSKRAHHHRHAGDGGGLGRADSMEVLGCGQILESGANRLREDS